MTIAACKQQSANTSETQANAITNQVDHLFEDGLSTYFLELKPIYMGEDSIEIDSNDFVYNSIIWPDGIDTRLIKNRTEISDPSTLKQLQILLNDTSEASMTNECYIPRHGIAWYNSNNDLEAFLEICFECQGYKTWGNIKIEGLKDRAWFGRFENLFFQNRTNR